jgi:type II secretory pathway pseudopilin PulG
LIALAITVVGIIAVGILAAIAIPVFLSQQKPANRNVVLPAMLVEQQQVHDATLDAASATVVAGLERDLPGLTQAQSGYYGSDGQPLFMVAAGKLPHKATAADEKAYFSTSGDTGSEQVVLAPVGSGPFGGKMECGTATFDGTPTTVCSSLDSAAAVVVISSQVSTSQLAVLARQIISSIEQKG